MFSMKKNSCLVFFLLTLACQAQEKKSIRTPHSKTLQVQSTVVHDAPSTITDPAIRQKNELPISAKTNPEVFFVDKEKPRAENVDTKKNSLQEK